MKTRFWSLLLFAMPLTMTAWSASIDLIGIGSVSGSALDKSGLTGTMNWPHGTPTNSAPAALFGGWGSAITYSGYGNYFLAAPDRGPGDGLVDSFLDRYHVLEVNLDPTSKTISISPAATTLLTNEAGQNLVGQSRDFAQRFDPEGIRVGRDGTFFVSDEYGPYIYQFDAAGNRIRTINVPTHFGISTLSEDGNVELTSNLSGRQTNRGMEGLAISPDGKYLYGIMQNALIQDGALDGTTRRGLYNRILKVDLTTGVTSEYVYPLLRRQNGVNEILAINDHEFLVLERDGDSGNSATFKQIYKIDITGATDVSSVTLPQSGSLGGVVPVSKSVSPFLDLLDPQFGLAGSGFPEKIEGLSWGPKLADGRLTLYVSSDNDFINTSQVYAFAIDPTLLDYQGQQLDAFVATPEPATSVILVPLAAIAALLRRKLKSFSCL